MVWEAEMYSCTTGKDGRPALERLTGDTIDISEWLEFYLYDIVWFWNKQSYYTKPTLVQWLGLSHRVVIVLQYCIINVKWDVISRTTVQNLTAEKPTYLYVQERICDYCGSLEAVFVIDSCGTILGGYVSLTNDDE